MRLRAVAVVFLAFVLACGARPPSSASSPASPPPALSQRRAPVPGGSAASVRYVATASPPAFVDPEARQKTLRLHRPKVGARVEAFFAREHPPSIAVAMVADGDVVLTKVLGVRDTRTKADATGRTLYRIGSITKTFTAALVLSLRDAGLVAPLWRFGAAEAAGGLWSSVEDMARWVTVQLDAWPPRSGADGPIARASLREAHLPSVATDLSVRAETGGVKVVARGGRLRLAVANDVRLRADRRA